MSVLPLRQSSKPENTERAAWGKQEYRLLALPAWLVALIVGLLVLLGFVPGTRGAGALCALMGVGGCVWELNYWAQIERARRRIAATARVQAAKKIKRQARQTEQRAAQRQRKAIQARTREAQELRSQAEHNAKIDAAIREFAEQNARFRQVTLETQRLQSLDAIAFRAEAERILQARGLHLQNEVALNDPALRLFRLSDGSLELAQFAADNAAVAVADIERLEHVRQQTGASRAYIIGRGHFTAPALRLSQRYPITFVESNLLAHWNISLE